MSIMSEFEDYKGRLNDAIAEVMKGQVSKEVRKEIETQANALVYSVAQEKARGSLRDADNYYDMYYRNGDIHTLEVEASHTFQGAPWGNYLSTVVERGWSNWNQPGPRPYMKTAERNMREKVAAIVSAALELNGV